MGKRTQCKKHAGIAPGTQHHVPNLAFSAPFFLISTILNFGILFNFNAHEIMPFVVLQTREIQSFAHVISLSSLNFIIKTAIFVLFQDEEQKLQRKRHTIKLFPGVDGIPVT